MHLSVPTCVTHQRTSTKCHGCTIDSSWAPGSSPAIPTWLPHQDMPRDWQQGCAGTGLPCNPNPLLWEGRSQQSLLGPNLPCCPGFQLQAQLCPNLQCRVRHSRNPLLLQIPVCPSPSPVQHSSQFHTGLGVQLAGLRLPAHTTHHPSLSIVIEHPRAWKLKKPVLLKWIDTFKGTRNPLPLSFMNFLLSTQYWDLLNQVNPGKSFKSHKSFKRPLQQPKQQRQLSTNRMQD